MNIIPPFDRLSTTFISSRLRLGMGLCLCAALLMSASVEAKTKAPRVPRPEPELKILDLNVSPNPYSPAAGPLEFAAVIQLPKELNGATLLEVSSFVTSPSKTSIRFLTTRRPLEPHPAAADGAQLPRTTMVLTWDGLDHKKVQAGAGLYHYDIRAKLLANGEKGPRTMMVSWPKRGLVEVK